MHLRLAHSNALNSTQAAQHTGSITNSSLPLSSGRPLDLSQLNLSQGVNQIRLRMGERTLCMSLPNSERGLNNMQVALIPNEQTGYSLEINVTPESNQTTASGLNIELTDGIHAITADQAELLGGFIADISKNYDPSDSSEPVVLRGTNSRTFETLLALSESPRHGNTFIKPSNVFELLGLSMYIGNNKTTQACQQWLLANMGPSLTTTNMPLFLQRIDALTQLPEHNWVDTVIHKENEHYTLPGLLKEILIMAFSKTPLSASANSDAQAHSINQLYNTIAEKTKQSVPKPLTSKDFPDIAPDINYTQRELIRSMSTNALISLTAILERKENHDKFGIFTSFKELKDLQNPSNTKEFVWEHSNLLCDAIYAAMAKNEGERTHYEALETLLTTVTNEDVCGPTTLEKTLKSPRGASLVQATAQANDDRTLELFLKYGANAKYTGTLGRFSANGNHKAVKLLLDHGASPNENHALLEAIKADHLPIVELLLKSGVKLTGKNYAKTDSPLNLAASAGNNGIIKALHQAGAQINHIHHRKWTELVLEVFKGRTYLDNYGNPSMVRVQHETQLTPLMVALHLGHIDTAQTLLELGADPEIAPLDEHVVFSAIRGDCSTDSTNGLLCLMDHDRKLLDDMSVEDAAYALKLAAYSGHNNLIRLLLRSPVFISDPVKSHRIKNEFNNHNAYSLYRKHSNKQPDVLNLLKPKRKLFNLRSPSNSSQIQK